jgi:hypothetical protein
MVIVVGVSLLSGGISIDQHGTVTGEDPSGEGPGLASLDPNPEGPVQPTPIVVGEREVAWVDKGPDGLSRLQVVVDEVCPAEGKSGCPTVSDAARQQLAIVSAPKQIVGSPDRTQAVAISKSAAAGDELVVVALVDATATPAPSSQPTASPSPVASDAASPEPSARASATTEPRASATVPAASAPLPSAAVASIEPSATPTQTAAARLAIATGIEVVGQSAAFSSSGGWFAFTARPADDATRTDVYVWRVGDAQAHAVTTDGQSYFASWDGEALIASRPDDPDTADSDPTTVSIDPATATESDAGDVWRPAVDGSGELAIVWDGSLRSSEDGRGWVPAEGSLELRAWSDTGAQPGDGDARQRRVTDRAPRDFDVRWDQTGEWVAVWLADEDDATVGRLTLYHVDRDEVRLEEVDGAPVDVPALSGFSIGDGRLAWATPRGQGGESSRIQIAAWSETDVGIVESSPGEDPIVIR